MDMVNNYIVTLATLAGAAESPEERAALYFGAAAAHSKVPMIVPKHGRAVCPQCSSLLTEEARYCDCCGQRVIWDCLK